MHFFRYNFKNSTILLLVLGLLSFYLLSIVTMAQSGDMASGKIAADCVAMPSGSMDRVPQPADDACVSYHIGLLHTLSEFSLSNLGIQFLIALVLAVVGFAFLKIAIYFAFYYRRVRIRLRQLYERTIFAFYRQLGFWLALLEKKDFAYAFAMA